MSENLENRISSTQAKDAIYKAHSISSSASEIDGNTKKTFTKIVKTFNKNPIDGNFLGISGGYNAYANAIKYNGEEFNAIKVYVKVKSNTTLRVQLIDPAQMITANWWERKPILVDGTIRLKASVSVKTTDRMVTVQLPTTVNASKVSLPYFYVCISTEEATTGVMLASSDVVIDTSLDTGGYVDKYSVIDTQKNTDSGFRFYDSSGKFTKFYFELLNINYDGLRTDNIEQSIIDREYTDNSLIVSYPNFYNCENIESHMYFSNFQKSLIKKYGYKYLCNSYGLALAEALRVGVQEDERFIKYNKALVLGNKTTDANVNFYETYYQKPKSIASFNHILSAASNGSGQTCNLLCVGESTTAGGEVTQRILDIQATDVMTVNCVGTRGTGVNKHEGVGGMTMTWHLTNNDSAFTTAANTFNYTNFIASIGGIVPNVVSIQIGINAMLLVRNKFDLDSKIDREMTSYTTFISNIKAVQSTTKFIVNTCILPSERQSSFGKNYDTYLNRDLYRENVQAYNEALIALFKDREAEGIYLNCTQTLALDCVNGFGSEAVALSEHTTTTVLRGSNGSGVHPNTYGYKLMGDALWACIKYIYKP